MHETHNEYYRYGSAGFADDDDVKPLLRKDGLPMGYWDNRLIRYSSDGGRLTIAGAGAGKTTTLLSYQLCMPNPNTPMVILDPRGELGAISKNTLAPQKIEGYYWNPKGIGGLPQHSCNPLDFITIDSPYFHTDIQMIITDFIPLSGGGNSEYFELRARDWACAFLKSRTEQDGFVSLPSFYRMVNKVESDPQAWADELEAMMASQFEDVRRCAHEMLIKQQDTPKEFGAIIGTLYARTSALDDPELRASLEGGDFSMSQLIGNPITVRYHLMPPAEYMGLWSFILRIKFSATLILKSRKPQARRILLLVDEAGQLGKAEFLLRGFTFSRGSGVMIHAFFQDIGQVRRLGADALTSLMGSATLLQFFGVRDFQTAQLVSNMLGKETLIYDDEGVQARAAHQSQARANAILYGADPFEHAEDYSHYEEEAQRQSKMQRPLMTPDEIMNMQEVEQIIFISGQNIPPIKTNKYPYFTRREMAGRYLPNPYHPPTDKVRVQGLFGKKWLRVNTVPIPQNYRLFPQYKGQTHLQQIEGYPL